MNIPRIYCPLCLTPISISGLSPGNPCQCPSCDYIFKPSFIAQPTTLRDKVKNVFDSYRNTIVITPFFGRFLATFCICLLVSGVFIWSDIFLSPRSDKVKIRNVSFYNLPNQLRIEGDIENPSSVKTSMPPITVFYQDENGRKISQHKINLTGALHNNEIRYFIAYVPLPTVDTTSLKLSWHRAFVR